jgi:hypothetical protein
MVCKKYNLILLFSWAPKFYTFCMNLNVETTRKEENPLGVGRKKIASTWYILAAFGVGFSKFIFAERI